MSKNSHADNLAAYSTVELPLDWAAQIAVAQHADGHHGPDKPQTRSKHARVNGHNGITNEAEKIQKKISPHLLADLQQEVGELERDRGTSSESVVQKSLILSEEAFEVLKVLRPRAGIATTKGVARALADELADILFVVAAIANRVGARLDILWEATEIDAKVSSAELTDTTEQNVLEASMDLAEQVLIVIVECRAYNDASTEGQAKQLADNIRGLIFLVQAVAAACEVDIRKAIESKLNKDQLRLWST